MRSSITEEVMVAKLNKTNVHEPFLITFAICNPVCFAYCTISLYTLSAWKMSRYSGYETTPCGSHFIVLVFAIICSTGRTFSLRFTDQSFYRTMLWMWTTCTCEHIKYPRQKGHIVFNNNLPVTFRQYWLEIVCKIHIFSLNDLTGERTGYFLEDILPQL